MTGQTDFQNILDSPTTFDISYFLELIDQEKYQYDVVSSNKKCKYYNIPASFDIETSSFYMDGEKHACMYMWSFGVNGHTCVGRTWESFLSLLDRLISLLDICSDYRLVIYIQNAGYEFQFMRKYFTFSKVFSIDTRKPLYALTNDGIEFRCSYLLSGYSLEKMGENLTLFTTRKLVGKLDYAKIRHSHTKITLEEIEYSASDVKVVMAYIQEKLLNGENISTIPLTKTGYVRKYCRNECFKGYRYYEYRDIIRELIIDSPEFYKQMKRAFAGGFTHANYFYQDKTVSDVDSYDITSSYPYAMVCQYFPMSRFTDVTIQNMGEVESYINKYCCIFDVEFVNVAPEIWCDSYLSESRCWNVKNGVINNGRILMASSLMTTMTELDFKIFFLFYSCASFRVKNFRISKRGYLPKDFIMSILKLYKTKTELKDVEGKESEYLNSKENINSGYGMMVTDIVRPEIPYTDDWQEPIVPLLEEALKKYNSNSQRFLYYAWGIWVTAHARYNLLNTVAKVGDDYIYSDTDSIKCKRNDRVDQIMTDYNHTVMQSIEKCSRINKIPIDMFSPKTKYGDVKTIGLFLKEKKGEYDLFKTLGAKRYLYAVEGKVHITVSGVKKSAGEKYLTDTYHTMESIFDHFTTDLEIPAGHTGKMTMTYIDDGVEGEVVDYLGVAGYYHELSCIHAEPTSYNFSISQEYSNFLKQVRVDDK